MKKEIDKNIYEGTLEYLDDKMRIYERFLSSSTSVKSKTLYSSHIKDCDEIRKAFIESFTPRKK